MAVGQLVSRGTGFLRTAAIGAAIGAVAVGDDYNLANTLPGMVYELLLGGVLASVRGAAAGAGPRPATPTGARPTPSGCSPWP